MKSKNKKESPNTGIVTGLLLAGIAGAYFLYGTKEGKRQKRKINSWAIKAKGEVLEKIEALKDVNQETYNKIVSGVIEKYKKIKHEHAEEIETVSSELAGYWKHIKKHLEEVQKKSDRSKSKAKK